MGCSNLSSVLQRVFLLSRETAGGFCLRVVVAIACGIQSMFVHKDE
jgi:hypothetical protein